MKINFNVNLQLPKAPPKVRFVALVVMALLLGSFVVSACSGYPFNGNPVTWLTAKEKFMDGCEQRKRFQLKDALVNLDKAVKLYPQDAHFQYGLGETLEQLEQYAEAADHFQQAVRLNSGYADAWLHLGAAQYQLGDKTAAETSTRTALKVSPDNPEAMCQLAALLDDQGKQADADVLFKKSNRYTDPSARYWYLAGRYLTAHGKPKEGLNALRRAALKDRGAPEYAQTYGAMLLKANHPQEASHWLRAAAKLNSKNPDGWELLGLSLHAAGDTEHAAVALDKAVQLAPDSTLFATRYGVLLMEMKRYQQATRVFRNLIDRNSDDIAVWNMYMSALSQGTSFGSAKQTFEEIFAKGNDRTKCFALTYLGDVYRMQGESDQSYDSYSKALAYNPPDTIKKYLDDRLQERKQDEARDKSMQLSPAVLRQLKAHLEPQVYKELEAQSLKRHH